MIRINRGNRLSGFAFTLTQASSTHCNGKTHTEMLDLREIDLVDMQAMFEEPVCRGGYVVKIKQVRGKKCALPEYERCTLNVTSSSTSGHRRANLAHNQILLERLSMPYKPDILFGEAIVMHGRTPFNPRNEPGNIRTSTQASPVSLARFNAPSPPEASEQAMRMGNVPFG